MRVFVCVGLQMCFESYEIWLPIDPPWSGLILHNAGKITPNPFKVLAGVEWNIIYSDAASSHRDRVGLWVKAAETTAAAAAACSRSGLVAGDACKLNWMLTGGFRPVCRVRQQGRYPVLRWQRQSRKVHVMTSRDCRYKFTKEEDSQPQGVSDKSHGSRCRLKAFTHSTCS